MLLSGSFGKASAQSYAVPSYFERDSIASFNLASTSGQKLKYAAAKKLSCFIFLSPDCPLCKNYAALINDLKKTHSAAVSFYLVCPGKSYGMGELKSFGKEYLKSAVIYRDDNLALSHYLRATVTPEVVLMESKTGKAVYAGALDNWAVSLGRQRNKATENYLQDAIESYLHNQPPPVAFKEPVGCLINDF